jgi:hypothetical protein
MAIMGWIRALTWQVILAFCALIITLTICCYALGWNPSQSKAGGEILVDAFAKAYSVVVTKDGQSIKLTSTIFLRMPAENSGSTTQPEPLDKRFDKFHGWLNKELGGWSRWSVESESTNSEVGKSEKNWMYVIGIAESRPNVTDEITHKVAELFPELHPVLIIELPHPLVAVDKQVPKG